MVEKNPFGLTSAVGILSDAQWTFNNLEWSTNLWEDSNEDGNELFGFVQSSFFQ